MTNKLWGGRFTKKLHPLVEAFTASIQFDQRLASFDIKGSIAWTEALARARVLTRADAKQIVRGLTAIGNEINTGKFRLDPNHEDIHMVIESRLTQKIGKVGEKLHTGRSRNDQVATDLRLYIKVAIKEILTQINAFQTALLNLAKKYFSVIMPGYTHLQHAQPVLFPHHFLAYFSMLERDKARFQAALARTDELPLGSGALAGTGFPIDRKALAKALGFATVSENSLDAVSDRDFVLETLSALAISMTHLSRLAEEMILWNTAEFSFIELPDDFATGSSMMPQKKNPDVAELIRGKTGRITGHLVALLTVLKGLPLAYNRDLQEDKEGLFDAIDTYQASLAVLTALLPKLKLKEKEIGAQLRKGHLAATDLADYLVKKGVPFREAHHIVGKMVQYAETHGKELSQLSLKSLQPFSKHFGPDVNQAISLAHGIALRDSIGGTSPKQVLGALIRARRKIR